MNFGWPNILLLIAAFISGLFAEWWFFERRVTPQNRTCQCGHREWAHRIQRNNRACTVRTDIKNKLNCACVWFVPEGAGDKELESLRRMTGVRS